MDTLVKPPHPDLHYYRLLTCPSVIQQSGLYLRYMSRCLAVRLFCLRDADVYAL